MQKDIVLEIEALKASGRFDTEWYLATYPDVSLLGMDAYEHYVKVGRRLGKANAVRRCSEPASGCSGANWPSSGGGAQTA